MYATTQMSRSSRALLHEVIPYMDVLTTHLTNFANDKSLHPSNRRGAKCGLLVMNKYYSLTDENICHRLAIRMSHTLFNPFDSSYANE